jgi:23S rRNA (guanosine2251-2'-O)-methyltransferase
VSLDRRRFGGPNGKRSYPDRKPTKEARAKESLGGRLITGVQPVREAIRVHGARLHKVWVEAQQANPALDALARFAHDRGAKVERVPRSELDRIAERHQGVLAVADDLDLGPVDLETPGPGAVILALDELEDPQNFGAIIRSAVALGAHAVWFPEHHAAPLTAATFRASAGAIEHARLCRVSSLPSALQAARQSGWRVLGLDAHGSPIGHIATGPESPRTVLVVGAEGKGLRRGVKDQCDARVALPMRGPIASLNASVAAALGLAELLRGHEAHATANETEDTAPVSDTPAP